MGATGRVSSRRRIAFIATVVGATATVIGVMVALIGVALNWYYAPRPPVPSSTPLVAPEPSPVPSPTPHPTATVVPPLPPPHDTPTFPLDFTLRDGEQRTFLGDQASVAAEFNQIGSEDFVTLRVGTTEGGSVPHAILGAEARFPVHVAGSDYSVFVLSVDKTARTVGVRISRNSESQEKRGQ